MNRRTLLTTACTVGLVHLGRCLGFSGEQQRTHMGVLAYSFSIRRAAERRGGINEPLAFLEHCRRLGAGGIQVPLGIREREEANRIRTRVHEAGMYLEGVVSLPRQKSEVERFRAEIRTAIDCGAAVVRTVLLSGRRYEVFRSREQFQEFMQQSRRSLTLAKPVVERLEMNLAIENHKDLRAEEQVEMLRWINSPRIGACIDTGNNMAFLEPASETVEALAPFAMTTHIKDMGVEEYSDGFLLSEVPLGSGILELPRILQLLQRARPGIRFNLEMITRDPLRIPCLTDNYWATMPDLPARRLAAMLATVRRHAFREGLPRISPLERQQQIAREEENVRRSLRHAAGDLGLRAR